MLDVGYVPNLKVDEAGLPSRFYEETAGNGSEDAEAGINDEIESEIEVDIDNEINSIDSSMQGASVDMMPDMSPDMSYLEKVRENIGAMNETLLINEYAIGMFQNAASHHDPNGKSMNGYRLDRHFLNYEAEYILGGSLEESRNLEFVLKYVYGLRTGLNLVHLTMDSAKRTAVMNIATTIAGWWTGGVGAVVIAVVIAAVWAMMESLADIFILLAGEKVPLLKTPTTWYTSLDGSFDELFNAGVRYLDDELTDLAEGGIDAVERKLDDLNDYVDGQMKEGKLSVEAFEEHKNEFERLLKEAANDHGIQIDYHLLQMQDAIESYLEKCLKEAVRQGVDSFVMPEISIMDQRTVELAEEIAHEGTRLLMGRDKSDRSLSAVIEIKKEVLQAYEGAIDALKEDYIREMEEIFSATLDVQMEGMKLVLGEMAEQGLDIGKEVLYERADTLKQELKKEIVKRAGTGGSDGHLDMSFVPCFSYEDYLRLIYLLPLVDERTKVARMMDLIQFNMQKFYDDYEISILNYFPDWRLKGMSPSGRCSGRICLKSGD